MSCERLGTQDVFNQNQPDQLYPFLLCWGGSDSPSPLLSTLMLWLWLSRIVLVFFFFLNTFSVSNRWFCFLTDGVTVAIRSCTLKNSIRIGKASGLTSVSRNLLLTGAAGASQAEFSVGNVDQPGM